MSAILAVHHIHKNYDDESILTNISFTLETGRSLAITGQSGSGKTTLLSIIGLLQQATSGQIVIAGQNTGSLSPKQQARLRATYLGFVFQRSRLINSLTAYENVVVPAYFARTGKNADKRALELLTDFGLEHRLNHRPQELSLGQLRRVALARALLLNPKILLADEPTNDLDPTLAKVVTDSLFQARDNGSTVIIVTHDLELAERADARLHLQQGRLTVPDVTTDLA
ncbi:ABC transporter ATP-binding protein [Propionispora vibrioides]|uniref:Putative ABC transport system ATP-binding protein n=1 Tax=Propionispora vibrioides TaxID=112903 RepID=A0A1H8T4D7_9FIRM|nr:ABC transporter ATP-binding protein [Propionispora vibrioides]SEO85791.1 putative ABC transport system ATP-binding protein [Propionispora vibrioides]